MRGLLNGAIDLLLPPRCAGCGVIVEAQGSFCAPCWAGLPFITALDMRALRAAAFRDGGRRGRAVRRLPRRTAPPRFEARAALAYDGPAREVVLRLKHSDRPHLAVDMAGHLRRAAGSWLDDDVLIVPVPLHRWRLWRRGYNQAAELAKPLARGSGKPLLVDALVRARATRSSQGLNPTERRRNLRGAFRIADAARPHVAGRCIVLVDDVLTTGATADACARVLRRAGAASVRLLTLARVVRPAGAGHIPS